MSFEKSIRKFIFFGVVAIFILIAFFKADTSSPLDFLLGLMPALALIMVVTGWEVTYWNGLKICSRNEAHQVASTLMEKIDQLDRAGCDFWAQTSEKRNAVAGELTTRRFLAMLQSVKLVRQVLTSRGFDLSRFDIEYAKLTDALTLNSEDPGIVSTLKCGVKISRISASACQIRKAAYSEFMDKYPHFGA